MTAFAGEAPAVGDLFGFLPRPIAVAVAIVAALAWVIGQITGQMRGPINALLRARDRREKEQDDKQQDGWRERDRQVDVLKGALHDLESEVRRLRDSDGRKDSDLRTLHRTVDAQNRLLLEHARWDRMVQARMGEHGIEVDAPPSLYVYGDDTQ